MKWKLLLWKQPHVKVSCGIKWGAFKKSYLMPKPRSTYPILPNQDGWVRLRVRDKLGWMAFWSFRRAFFLKKLTTWNLTSFFLLEQREEREGGRGAVNPTRPQFRIRGSGKHIWPTLKKGFDECTCTQGPLANKRTVMLGRIGIDRMKNSNAWKTPNKIPQD